MLNRFQYLSCLSWIFLSGTFRIASHKLFKFPISSYKTRPSCIPASHISYAWCLRVVPNSPLQKVARSARAQSKSPNTRPVHVSSTFVFTQSTMRSSTSLVNILAHPVQKAVSAQGLLNAFSRDPDEPAVQHPHAMNNEVSPGYEWFGYLTAYQDFHILTTW
jgi:hypothetical protein